MSPIHLNQITTLTVLKYLLGIIIIALLGTYITFQARLFIAGPSITLVTEPDQLQNNRTVTLAGAAANITAISVNGRPITTDEAGNFAESVVLENGYSEVSIVAVDRYNRRAAVTRNFVYLPQSFMMN